jgi:hypothetical protein
MRTLYRKDEKQESIDLVGVHVAHSRLKFQLFKIDTSLGLVLPVRFSDSIIGLVEVGFTAVAFLHSHFQLHPSFSYLLFLPKDFSSKNTARSNASSNCRTAYR